MNKKIWLSSPHMCGKELEFVKDAFDTNWIAPLGPHVNGFEDDICNYLKTDHAAVLSSGTAAIHLALIILGVRTGDEVICQSMTFSASANPIVYQGATPIFVDSEEDTWNMCPELLEATIKDRLLKGMKPKAIIPVHLYGMPAKMDEIMSIAARYEIPVIEDAAEALGSKYDGKYAGSFGDFGILSFNGNKIITTSGGGALVSHSKEAIQQAYFLATQARDNAPHYEHSQIGYNYRMSNVCAAIGRGQMLVLEQRVKQRIANFNYYKKKLSNNPAIKFLEEFEKCNSNRWLTTILIDNSFGVDKGQVRLALEKENIETRPLWKPMHMQPIFASAPFYGNGVSEELFKNGLCLPSGSNLTLNDLDRVINAVEKCFVEVFN